MSFSNSSFIVIGAYGGIGSVVSKTLKENGANLLLAGKDPSKLEVLSNELNSPFFSLDASDFSQVDSLIEFAIKTFGVIDGIVNTLRVPFIKTSPHYF